MFKHYFSLFFIFSFFSLSSIQMAPIHIIDYGKFKTSIKTFGEFERKSWQVGFSAFNYSTELIPFFAKLRRDYKIDVAVETGTFLGGTTVAFSSLFDKVHTIEIDENLFKKAKKNLKPFRNIQCHQGSSERVLRELLPTLQEQRILFYLDAHWKEFWPLNHELEEISHTHKDNCIIVIDDFKVPNRVDIPYDRYDDLNECSYECIKSHLDLVFTNYICYILIPKNIYSRAKFIAIPKSWKTQPSKDKICAIEKEVSR